MSKFYAYTNHRLFDDQSYTKTRDELYREKLAEQRRTHLPNINRQFYENRAKLMVDRIRKTDFENSLVLVEIDLLDSIAQQLGVTFLYIDRINPCRGLNTDWDFNGIRLNFMTVLIQSISCN